MATTSGRFLALRKETVYGDGGSGDWKKIRVTGIGDPVNRNAAFEEAIDIAVATAAVGGAYKVSGTIDATLRFKSFAGLFESMLGSPSGDYYYLGDTPVPYSFLIGDDQAGRQVQYKGCGISSMEFNLSVGQFITTKISWIGQNAIVKATTDAEVVPDFVVAPANDKPAIWYNAIVKVAGVPVTAKSITLRIDRKFDQDYIYIGSPVLQGLYMNGQTEASGTITLGSGEWSQLQATLTGGTGDSHLKITTPQDSGNNITQSAGTESLNQLYSGAFEIVLHDADGNEVGIIHAGTCVFNESNRSVQGRNQWEKSINYRVVVPTSTDFYVYAKST